MARFFLILTVLIGVLSQASAHEVRPAYLQIREIEPGMYDVLWKTPAQGDMRLALNVILPSDCQTVGQPRSTAVDGAAIEHWRTQCDGGLPGKTITIENLETSLTDAILRFEPYTVSARTLRITGDAPSVIIPERQSLWQVARTYFDLGVEHILFGFDHLLFVFCLVLLVRKANRLLGAVTAFTVAHSITLGATTLGWVHLAIAPVEACIALSIAFIAAEIIRARQGQSGLTQRWPWVASFAFGLLHGFGFASALREIGLPEGAIPMALLFFNLGVEAGQVLFVGAMLIVMVAGRRLVRLPPQPAWRLPTYAAGSLAGFWFIERVAGILL